MRDLQEKGSENQHRDSEQPHGSISLIFSTTVTLARNKKVNTGVMIPLI